MGPDEAAQALRDAEAAASRSVTAAGYQQLSAHLFIWGAVWIALNVAGVLKAPFGQYLFPGLMLAGLAGSLVVAARRGGRLTRTLWTCAAIGLFVLGVGIVTPTNSLIAAETLVCLGIGAAYMMLGGTVGSRLAVVGLVQMAGTMAAWLWGRDQFFAWMTVIGGGGLVLGGFWLRKA